MASPSEHNKRQWISNSPYHYIPSEREPEEEDNEVEPEPVEPEDAHDGHDIGGEA